MNINQAIFKAYDIRGIYPDQLNEENIVSVMKAIYTFFVNDLKKNPISLVLGRDMRTSSPSLYTAALRTFIELGAQIINIGVVPTPTVYDAAIKHKTDACIQISASHNPKEYNGIKFAKIIDGKATKIGNSTGMATIRELVQSKQFVSPQPGGKVEEDTDAVAKEVESAIEEVHPTHIKPLKIVVDPANAMGIAMLEELFKHYPDMQVIKMNFELDGSFPNHQADPSQPKNLVDIQKKVVEEHADLGIAPDGDADRIFFINEKGVTIDPTLITSLITKELLKNNPHAKILVDIRYIYNVMEAVKQLQGTLAISKVGHAFITEQLNKEKAIFAGESSGHYFFASTGGAESAIRVLLYVLEVMGREQKPVSEIVATYSTSYESGEMNFKTAPGFDVKQFLESLPKKYVNSKVSWLDGISISYPDWRFNIRTSNTEPLMRLNAEGPNKVLVTEKVKELTNMILATGAHQEK